MFFQKKRKKGRELCHIFFLFIPHKHTYTTSALQINSFKAADDVTAHVAYIRDLWEKHWEHETITQRDLKWAPSFLFCSESCDVFFFLLSRSKSGVRRTLKIAFIVGVAYFGWSRLWTPQKEGLCSVCQGLVFVNRWWSGVARGSTARRKWHENGWLHTAVHAVLKTPTLQWATQDIMSALLTMSGYVWVI